MAERNNGTGELVGCPLELPHAHQLRMAILRFQPGAKLPISTMGSAILDIAAFGQFANLRRPTSAPG